jgi:hypothetical protein
MRSKLSADIKNAISGVGTAAVQTNLITDIVTNNIFTTSNINNLQTAINSVK